MAKQNTGCCLFPPFLGLSRDRSDFSDFDLSGNTGHFMHSLKKTTFEWGSDASFDNRILTLEVEC